MNEFDWIEWIKKKAGRPPQGWLGIGDDAAIFPPTEKGSWVVSTDAIVEGVDFDFGVTAAQVGRKALAINLSDIAAMGASPTTFLMTLGVPPSWKSGRLRQFINGVFQLARKYRVACVGGDMSSAAQFFCSITIFGKAPERGVVLRSGAKVGDLILVTGSLGGSIHKKHYAFTPRVHEAEWLVENFNPTAMLDVSDGLTQDLFHVLRASRCAAQLDLDKIPVSQQAKNIQSALSDGEDFELLMTVSPKVYQRLKMRWKKRFPKVALSPIGRMIKGSPRIEYFKNGILQKQFRTRPGFRHRL